MARKVISKGTKAGKGARSNAKGAFSGVPNVVPGVGANRLLRGVTQKIRGATKK